MSHPNEPSVADRIGAGSNGNDAASTTEQHGGDASTFWGGADAWIAERINYSLNNTPQVILQR